MSIGSWALALTPASTASGPGDLPLSTRWYPAEVPGTAAGALRAAGLFTLDQPRPLHDQDVWYQASLQGAAPAILRFEGLGVGTEVWLDDELIFTARSMFAAYEHTVENSPKSFIYLCFRSLDAELERQRGRAKWRPSMIDDRRLRSVRTTLLGHMPGWCPSVDLVGPWRPVEIVRPAPVSLLAGAEYALQASLAGKDGKVALQVRTENAAGWALEIAGRQVPLERRALGLFCAELTIEAVSLWWPHTHGEPRLYDVRLVGPDSSIELDPVGFRQVVMQPGPDGRGLSLTVNEQPVFCRGAVWAAADLVDMPNELTAFEPWLRRARDAGMNMIRLSGVGVYEADAFYACCDRLGLMVWQDFMFANFDYPADPDFRASVEAEAEWFLCRTAGNASLAVLCGGSEVYQQAAMLGLPGKAPDFSLFETTLADCVARNRPDVPYVPNSPSGGALPFEVDRGVAHYYGVGAYLRPLDDVRRSAVSFAAECLAFAHMPDAAMTEAFLARNIVPGHHPAWKEAVPRDLGASWDFEDVRDHYLEQLFAVDARLLRRENLARYLDLSRATTCELVVEVFSEWRRSGASCGGALVWMLQDLRPGAGWGVLDASGAPKPVWHGLKRVLAPIHLGLTDEGVNGLALHAVNETAQAIEAELSLVALSESGAVLAEIRHELLLQPRESVTHRAWDLSGRFFDFTYAYRFGSAAHVVNVATLRRKAGGELLAEASHFPRGRALPSRDLGLTARLGQDALSWFIDVESKLFAQNVHFEDEHYLAALEWCHVWPGAPRRFRLEPRRPDIEARPDGRLVALNGLDGVRYRA